MSNTNNNIPITTINNSNKQNNKNKSNPDSFSDTGCFMNTQIG